MHVRRIIRRQKDSGPPVLPTVPLFSNRPFDTVAYCGIDRTLFQTSKSKYLA